MGRMYTASFKAIGVTAVQDFFELTAASGVPTRIHGWALTQHTEVGDVMEEGLSLTTNRGIGATTSGSGGASVTPNPIDDSDIAAATTIERNNTTIMAVGSGSLEELEAFAWNVRVPFLMWYTPETRPLIKGGARWTLECETTPADSISISGTIWFEENG